MGEQITHKHRVSFITIVPSPYQRDLFGALAARGDVDLRVYYVDATSPENPWPEKSLRPFEKVLPGFSVPVAGARAHVNWELPDMSEAGIVVLSTFTSVTGQWLMRRSLRSRKWLFWGERLHANTGIKGFVQTSLAAPISRSSGIVAIGRAAEEDYGRRFPNLPQFCIPYHCDLVPFFGIARDTAPRQNIRFLFCGQMIRRKGIDLLLIAFERLVERGMNVTLTLLGREADLPHFMGFLKPLTRSRIVYEGFQAPDRLSEYFDRGDVFVLPSRYDGWGVVINQALAAGMPIITTDAVGAGLDLVDNGINGVRVQPGDPEALYRAMEMIATNPDLVPAWGARSRERAFKITPEVGAEKWIRVLEAVGTE